MTLSAGSGRPDYRVRHVLAQLIVKTVAIVQSNYIPWKGYFDLINSVDEFILYDDAQYTTRDWRNRNKIKVPTGTQWLTIPVQSKNRRDQRICDAVTQDNIWRSTHWKTISHAYATAPYFKMYKDDLESLYLESDETSLYRINFAFLRLLCSLLGIATHLSHSMDYEVDSSERKTARLVSICKAAGAQRYLSGPSAQSYIEEVLFADAGITLDYFDYAGYPEYPQLFPPFEHGVSVIDLLLSVGPDAPQYMKSFHQM